MCNVYLHYVVGCVLDLGRLPVQYEQTANHSRAIPCRSLLFAGMPLYITYQLATDCVTLRCYLKSKRSRRAPAISPVSPLVAQVEW
jgi:hypothetical protein